MFGLEFYLNNLYYPFFKSNLISAKFLIYDCASYLLWMTSSSYIFIFKPYFAFSYLKRLYRGLSMTQDFLYLREYSFLFSLDVSQRTNFRVFEYFTDTFWIAISSSLSVILSKSFFARIWHFATTL